VASTPRDARDPRDAREMAARGREFLERRGVEAPRLEAELLVAHALGLDRLRLFLELDRPVEPDEVARARELLVRRGAGEPVAYLTGVREFYGRPFRVTPDVLIPRPETELLVDLAREHAAEGAALLDVGTGSGCLAVTLALEIPGARVVATDLSAAALAVARVNAEALGAEVELREGDGVEPARGKGPFDVVVCNPPYVVRGDAAALAPDVRDHEPALALYAPDGDPDHWVRRLADAAGELLAPGGVLLVELGYDQSERALELARSRGLAAEVLPDLAGVPRVLRVTRASG
jgi:release factor glutamine methyltransferase